MILYGNKLTALVVVTIEFDNSIPHAAHHMQLADLATSKVALVVTTMHTTRIISLAVDVLVSSVNIAVKGSSGTKGNCWDCP